MCLQKTWHDNTVVNSNTLVDDKDDTEDEIMEQHMDMPRRSARKVIPPAKLGDYVWKRRGVHK